MLLNTLVASVLLVVALSAPAPPSCPSGWKLYQPRNVCFIDYPSFQTWQRAREKCQESGADLLQIEDEAMNDWISANRKWKGYAHWIGVSDQDVDGKFEYLDGHDLVTASSGLGSRNIEGLPIKGDCVYLRGDNKGWGSGNCQDKLKYLCERPQGMKGDCPRDWYLYPAERKCLTSSQSSKSWADARKHCQELGGDLLVIGDQNKKEFVKDKREAGFSHWIGVKYSQENKEYELVNGQKLYPESKGLGKWGSFRNYNSRKDNFCVTQGSMQPVWGNNICSARLLFFCGKPLYPKEMPQTKEEDSDNVNDAQQRDEDVVENTMAQEENSEEEHNLENDAVTEDLEREEPDSISEESVEESESIPEGYNEDSNVPDENGDVEVEEDGDELDKLSVDLDSNRTIDLEDCAVIVEEVDDDSGESENKIEVVKLDSKPKRWKPFDFLPVYYVR